MTKKEFIFNELKKAIISGKYKAGSILISENDICSKYSVSREPVRRALKQLKEKGFVSSKQGKGYFVNPPELYINSTISSLSIESKGEKKVIVLKFEKIKNSFKYFESKYLYFYERIVQSQENVVFERGYLPSEVFLDFSIEDCQTSIMSYFKEKGVVLSHDLKVFTSELIDGEHPIQKYLKEPITHSIQTVHHVYSHNELVQISSQIKKDSKVSIIVYN